MEQMNFLDLNDYMLEEIVKCMPLGDQCRISKVCERIQELCIGIWRRNKMYCDTINYDIDNLSFEDYRYFICLMCEHINGLVLRTTDVEAFSKATKNKELTKLKALRIDRINSTEGLPSISFIKKCNNLAGIFLTEPLLDAYMDDVLQIQSLKRLEVIRYYTHFDIIVKRLVDAKQTSIKKIHTEVDKFPPCWLSEENTFPNLEELGIDSIHAKSSYYDTRSAPLLKLKILYVHGWNYCQVKMVRFVRKCPNLTHIILYSPNGLEVLMQTAFFELHFDQINHEGDIVEFRKVGQEPFEIPEPIPLLYKNRTQIFFI